MYRLAPISRRFSDMDCMQEVNSPDNEFPENDEVLDGDTVIAEDEPHRTPWVLIVAFFASYVLLSFMSFHFLILPIVLGAWLLWWSKQHKGEVGRRITIAVISAFACTAVGVVAFFQTNKAEMESAFPFLFTVGGTLLALAVVGFYLSRKKDH